MPLSICTRYATLSLISFSYPVQNRHHCTLCAESDFNMLLCAFLGCELAMTQIENSPDYILSVRPVQVATVTSVVLRGIGGRFSGLRANMFSSIHLILSLSIYLSSLLAHPLPLPRRRSASKCRHMFAWSGNFCNHYNSKATDPCYSVRPSCAMTTIPKSLHTGGSFTPFRLLLQTHSHHL